MDRLRRLRDIGHFRYVLLYGVICGMCFAVAFAVLVSWSNQMSFFDVFPWTALVFGLSYALVGEIRWRLICSRCDRDERDCVAAFGDGPMQLGGDGMPDGTPPRDPPA